VPGLCSLCTLYLERQGYTARDGKLGREAPEAEVRSRLLWKLVGMNVPVIGVVILVVWLAINHLAADYFMVLMKIPLWKLPASAGRGNAD
jgi:hypothetical protein